MYNVQKAEAELKYSEEPQQKLLSPNDAPTILSDLPPKRSRRHPNTNSLSDSARGRSSESDSDEDTTDPKSRTLTSSAEIHMPPDADERYSDAPRRKGDIESAC